jgi:mono/diheme cytochrome c family protein
MGLRGLARIRRRRRTKSRPRNKYHVRMKMIGLLIILWAIAAAPSTAADVVFKSHGKIVRAVSVSELTALLPPRDITVWDPHEEKEVAFQAFAANDLFAKIYGDDWNKSEEALFTCSDGFQPSLPMAEFGSHQGYLAFSRNDSPEFSVASPDKREKVPLGPFYLIWENIKDPSIRRQGTIPGWPYQVTTIDLIRFADRFPRMSPPPGSSAAVQRGFFEFRKRCLSCHTVNGDGGGKGVELNYPANPTEYWRGDWLKRWITDPKSVRYNTEMHAFNRDGASWEENLDAIIAYLKVMAQNKKRPKDALERP